MKNLRNLPQKLFKLNNPGVELSLLISKFRLLGRVTGVLKMKIK